MFTIDAFWKLLQIVQGGTVDEVTEAVIAIAKNEATSAEKLFSTIIDQAAYSTPDYYGLRNFIRDLYATHRTLTTYQTSISDVYKMPNDQLDELFRSFGYPYSTSLRHPTGNESPSIKINFFLDLVNIYKRKGTPQSLLDVLSYYGLNKVDLYELSLLWDDRTYGSSDDVLFKTNKIAGTSEDKSTLYFNFDYITDQDPHWLQTKDQVKHLHTINKINFPSQSPYFAIKPVYDEKTIDAETGIISAQVRKQYNDWVIAGSKPEDTDPTLPQTALLTVTGDVCSFLTNYLACVYTFNKIWNVGAPAARYVCYDGTNTTVESVLEEFDSIANVRVDTHAQWKALYEKYLDIFTLPISENFLQDHLDARDVLAILNPTVKNNLDTLAISLEEVLGSLLVDLGEWIRSYMSFGFTNISYILFGIDSMFSNLRKVIEFFKPYRARLVPLEYLQFTSRLFNSVIVEDQFNFDVDMQFHDFLTGDSSPCCNGEIECFSEDIGDLIKVSAPVQIDDSSITVYLPDPILSNYAVAATMSSRNTDPTKAGSFGMVIVDKKPSQFEVLLSSPTADDRYWLDFMLVKYGSNAGVYALPLGSTFIINLPVAQADSNYPLFLTLENQFNPKPSKYAYTIIDKTPTSFTIKFSDDIDSADYLLNWIIPTFGKVNKTPFTDSTQTITFSQVESNNLYAVVASVENLVDMNRSQYLCTVVDKKEEGFVIKMNSPPDSTNYNIVWDLYRYRDTIGKGGYEEDVCILDATSCLQTQTYSREFYDCGSDHDEGAVTDAPRELFIQIEDNIYDNLRCPVVDTTGFVVNEVNQRVYKSNVEVIPWQVNTVYYNMLGDEEPDPYFSLVACISNVNFPASPMLGFIVKEKNPLGFRIDLSDLTENPGYRIDWTKSRDPDDSGLKGLNMGDTTASVVFTSPKPLTTAILVGLETTDSTTSSQIFYEITERSTTGFTVRFSHPMPSDNFILNWITKVGGNSGVEPLSYGTTEATIVFPNTTLNEYNAIIGNFVNITDTPASIYPFKIVEKTITSFKVKFSSPIDGNNYYFSWFVHGAENKLDELLYIQTGGFRHFDEEGVFDCTHGFDLVSITIDDITDYMLLEDGFYILQENGDRILL